VLLCRIVVLPQVRWQRRCVHRHEWIHRSQGEEMHGEESQTATCGIASNAMLARKIARSEEGRLPS
jgi:hypothetical protein